MIREFRNLIGATAAVVMMAAAVLGCAAAGEVHAATPAAETTAVVQTENAEHRNFETYKGDGWNITYDKDLFAAKKLSDGVLITYMGESTLPHYICIRDDGYPTPADAIANLGDRELTDAAETTFMGQKALYRMTKDNGASDGVVEVFMAFEHRGKVTSVEQRSPIEKDEELGMKISDTMAAMVQTFEVTD